MKTIKIKICGALALTARRNNPSHLVGMRSTASPFSFVGRGTFGTRWNASLPMLAFALLAGAFSASAQSYSVDWYKVSGGGGTSTGGVYSVNGTIGQHDAGGPMTGGNYYLTGGFWSLYAVQTSGAPALTIKLTTTNTAMVFWPSTSTGFNLQVNTNLVTTNWVTPAESIADNGTIKYIIVNPPTGNRFYRLKNP